MEGLFFKIAGGRDVSGRLLPDELFGLCGVQGLIEKLIDGQKRDGQRIDPSPADGLYPIDVGSKVTKTLYVPPDMVMRRMEDMRPIVMEHDACLRVSCRMAVAPKVWAFINQGDVMASLGEMARRDGSTESRLNDTELHGRFCLRGLCSFDLCSCD